MRKQPIHHDVKSHIRSGVRVHHYERGSGKAPRKVIGASSLNRAAKWLINVRGGTGRNESFTVGGSSSVEAVSNGVARASFTPTMISFKRR